MWYIHIVEYYLAIRKNEVLIHATTWMDLENIMLSEISQTQKATYCMLPFIHIGKSLKTESRLVAVCS